MQIKALILDWDGVWTSGRKRPDGHSEFSEHDTMGLNLLRFAHYAQTGTMLPVAVVTGERNLTAEFVTQREHYDHFLFYARDKTNAIPLLETAWDIPCDQWGFLFDDVLDLGLALRTGRRGMVQWPFTRRIQDLASELGAVDDWIAPESPIRAWCETYLAEQGWLEDAVHQRMQWSSSYQEYWATRNQIVSQTIDLSR